MNTPHKPSRSYKVVDYFLHNRQLTILLLALIVIIGAVSFTRLRVEGFPEVEIPVAIVTTVVPGAGPETVNNTVTVPIENALKDVKDIKQVSATSQTNVSVVVLTFADGVDTNVAIQDARTKLATVQLPEGVEAPDIIVPEISTAPFFVAVAGGTDLVQLENQAKILEEKLLAIDGVESFTLTSGIEQNIYIDLAPEFQTPQVTEQIKAANIGFPLGETVIDGKKVPVSGQSNVTSLDEVRNILISVPERGAVKLGDLAAVYIGVDYADRVHRVGYLDEEANKFNILPALLYEVSLESDASILQLDKDVTEAVENTKPSDSKVSYAIVFNQAAESQRQVDEIVEAAVGGKWDTENPIGYLGFLFGGVWLLVLAMLVFLDWRSALISALAIPLSFLFTFLVLGFLGIQLNTLVLFSLILVLGLIVDPAIVVLESIKRYMEIGLKGKTAVLRSVDVIGPGLFIAVVTSMVVFVPFSVVSGTFGQIIKYIPLTVFPALIASYFIPLIFLTWLGARFLKADSGDQLRDEDDVHTLWPIAQWFIKANRYILHRRWLSILVIVLGVVVPIGISAALFSSGQVRQVQFAQPDDNQYLQLRVPRPANQSYRDLNKMATEVESILKKHAGEMLSFSYISLDGSSGSDNLSVFIELLQAGEREKGSKVIAEEIQTELQAKYGNLAVVQEVGAGPPTGEYPVSVKIFENDPAKLESASSKISEQLRSYSEIDSVITDYDRTSTELVVSVDPEKAASRGLSPVIVYGQISNLLGEKTLFRAGELDVVVRTLAESKPTTVEQLRGTQIWGAAGPVPLTEIASITESKVPGAIQSLDGERYAAVSARVKDARDAINVQRKITDWAKGNTDELGLSSRAFEDRAGVNEFEKSFQELFLAIGFAIFATYVLFVLFFRSFIQPLIILFAVPLILIGVFPALAFFADGQFGFLETIGILMVIGIVENVGIFLIDYANRKVAEGMDKKEAIALASGIRFRPVILTKVTALVGLLPLAVFSPFWRGLSVVVIFGILSSGILSLFTTPVLYSWFTRRKNVAPVEPMLEPSVEVPHPTSLPPNLPV
jgi:hydrophobic/amphiphilic exporter-1 (mainly G- bacteria), HAE1 family